MRTTAPPSVPARRICRPFRLAVIGFALIGAMSRTAMHGADPMEDSPAAVGWFWLGALYSENFAHVGPDKVTRQSIEQSELRMKLGDDPAWAARDLDAASWALASRDDVVRKNTGVFWVRFKVRSRDDVEPIPSGVHVGTAASYAVSGWHHGPGFDGELPAAIWRATLLAALACAGWAAWRRRPGAWLVTGGLAATLVMFELSPFGVMSGQFLLVLLPTMIAIIIAIGLSARNERRAAEEVKRTAARLETELLKKTLQPHFLMNTLTALAQTMEETPSVASKLIDDLAAEFRALARFAGEKRVPLSAELELCRSHLRVMSVRTERPWLLEADGVDPSAGVPPAMVLTLIENGFSHQQPNGVTTFSLRAERLADDGVRYTFLSPGQIHRTRPRSEGGTGLRYVKARLEEGWPGRWSFDQHEIEGGWQTVIEMRGERAVTSI